MPINLLSGSAQDNWADKDIQVNLKQIINKKHAVLDEKGNVAAGSSKRSCFSKLIHNHKMKNTESKYFASKVAAAIKEYNFQAEKINKAAGTSLADPTKIAGQIKDLQKNIVDADAKIAEFAKAKADKLAPSKAAEAQKETLLSALKEVGVTNIDTINGQIKEIKALDDQDAALDQEVVRLNTDNSNRYAKYPVSTWGFKGIRFFNEGGDKEASIKKINEAGYTPNETKALTEDVLKVIENNARLAAIPAEKKKIADLKKDIVVVNTPALEDVAAKIAANSTKEGLTTLTDFDSINLQIAALDKEVVDQKEAIAKSAEFAAIESQLQAANAVKAQAVGQIAKLNQLLGVKPLVTKANV